MRSPGDRRTSRGLALAVLGAAGSLLARAAAGDDASRSAEPVHLVYHAATGCPTPYSPHAAVEATPAPLAPRPLEATAQARAEPPLARPAGVPRHRLFLGASIGLASGPGPDMLPGFSGAVGYRAPTTGLIAPLVRASFVDAAGRAFAAGSGTASFTWIVGRLDGCLLSWPPGPAHLQPCARVEAGVLDAAAAQVAGAQTAQRGWFAAGPLLRGEWELWPPLFLDAEVAAMVHATDDHFYFVPQTTVYTVPLFGVEAAAGLGVHFL